MRIPARIALISCFSLLLASCQAVGPNAAPTGDLSASAAGPGATTTGQGGSSDSQDSEGSPSKPSQPMTGLTPAGGSSGGVIGSSVDPADLGVSIGLSHNKKIVPNGNPDDNGGSPDAQKPSTPPPPADAICAQTHLRAVTWDVDVAESLEMAGKNGQEIFNNLKQRLENNANKNDADLEKLKEGGFIDYCAKGVGTDVIDTLKLPPAKSYLLFETPAATPMVALWVRNFHSVDDLSTLLALGASQFVKLGTSLPPAPSPDKPPPPIPHPSK